MDAVLNDSLVQAIQSVMESFPEVATAAVFGSVARGDGGPYSDIDIAISVPDEFSLSDYILLAESLEARLARRIDLITLRHGMPLSSLGLLGREIENDGVIVYERKAERPASNNGRVGKRAEGVKVRR